MRRVPSSHTSCCPRCGEPLVSWITSIFNTEDICIECAEDERQAPGYAAAKAAEEAAVRAGNLNYQGVGLSEADHAFLAMHRAERAEYRRQQKCK